MEVEKMALFDIAYGYIMEEEGGLVDHPDDPGGITKFGISLRFLRSIGLDLNRDGIIDGIDIRNLSPLRAKAIYKKEFWNKMKCDKLPDGIDLAVFDCSVNQGKSAAAKLLQKAARVKVDGIIGPITITAIEFHLKEVLDDFMARRALRYAMTPKVFIFGLGWYRRLIRIYRLSLEDLEAQ